MSKASPFVDLSEPIAAAVCNIQKWYWHLDDSDAYVISFILDPHIKLAYAEKQWDAKFVRAAKSRLEAVFDVYYKAASSVKGLEPAAPRETQASPAPAKVQYGYSFIQEQLKARQESDRAKATPRDELKAYLRSPLETTPDVLLWWGSHMSQYPTLSRMARDYLAIQGSATPSERAFSSAKLTGSSLRNRLTPEIFEAIQILKGAYRSGHISASEEARTSLQAQFEELHADPEYTK
ncbi:hypothetical protein ONZ45_g5791 [Pleurotus djamor]|nr:hypothetical protein ONZ45_g5791 [Pleurotus djamor]